MRIPLSFLVGGLILAEIALLIVVGERVGVLGALCLILVGMIAGVVILYRHGAATVLRVRTELAAGRVPARPLAEGAAVAIAALLIILPGFITDVVGTTLLVPAVREALWRRLRRRVEVKTAAGGSVSTQKRTVVELGKDEYSAPASPGARRSQT